MNLSRKGVRILFTKQSSSNSTFINLWNVFYIYKSFGATCLIFIDVSFDVTCDIFKNLSFDATSVILQDLSFDAMYSIYRLMSFDALVNVLQTYYLTPHVKPMESTRLVI